MFQPPAPSDTNNPLSILTQVADSLRIASLHGVDIVLFPELFLSCGSEQALDREGYELNIVGNICQELNVACLIGYAESIHESELQNNNTNAEAQDERGMYHSIAAFNADGSRAGNYRSISSSNDDDFLFRTGQPFVESIPTLIQLPNRGGDTISTTAREIKVGLMCGNDVLIPEHCRNLVRSGTQAIFASTSFKNDDQLMVKCFIPTRAVENHVPFLFANYAQPKETGVNELNNFVGSSAIVSKDGSYLVCAPKKEGDDLPIDCGYLIPCQIGALYAADIEISID